MINRRVEIIQSNMLVILWATDKGDDEVVHNVRQVGQLIATNTVIGKALPKGKREHMVPF